MAIPYSVSEILAFVNKQPTLEDRVVALTQRTREYRHVFAKLFEHAFDPSKKLFLAPGTPKYTPSDFPGVHAKLYGEVIHHFYLFESVQFPAEVRERQFLNMLEAIDANDASTLIAIKDQKLDELYPNVTINLVDRVYPELDLVF